MIIIDRNFIEGETEEIDFEGDMLDFMMFNLAEEWQNNNSFLIVIKDKEDSKIIQVNNYTDADFYVKKDMEISIVITPQFVQLGILLLKILVLAVITYILMKYFAPDEEGNDYQKSLYSFNLDAISSKEGGIIDENFGTFIVYPKLISKPYVRYEDNEEVMYLTTVVGVGDYFYNEMYIDKTPVQDIVFPNNRQCDGTVNDKVINCISPNNDVLKIWKFDSYETSLNVPDSRYRYIINEVDSLTNFNLLDFSIHQDYNTGVLTHDITKKTKGALLNKDFSMEKIEIDIELSSLYYTDDDGDKHDTSIGFRMFLYRFDDFGNKISIKNESYTLNKKLERATRLTIEFSAQYTEGVYLELSDLSAFQGNDSKISNNWTIKRVKAISSDRLIRTNSVSYSVFKIKTGSVFNEQNKMKIGLKVERKGLTKMNDVINYIWNSTGYNYLELSDSQELMNKFEVHGAIDKQDSLYKQLGTILSARELMLLPILNGLIIKQDGLKDVRVYNFDKSKIVKDSLDINYKSHDTKKSDGFKSVYFDTEGEKQEAIYPLHSVNPMETIVFGINNNVDAENHSRIGYNKLVAENKTIKFKTSLVGYIPELEDKIGVTAFYINESYSSELYKVDINNNKIILKTEVLLKGGEYCIIKNDDNSIDNKIKIVNTAPGLTRTIELDNFNVSSIDTNKTTILVIGEDKDMFGEYIVKLIKPISSSVVEITAKNYDKRVFDGSNPWG